MSCFRISAKKRTKETNNGVPRAMNTDNFFILPKISYDVLSRAPLDALKVLILLGQSPDMPFNAICETLGLDRRSVSDALSFWQSENVLSEADMPRASGARVPPTAQALTESLYSGNFSFAVKEAESVWGALSRREVDALHMAHNDMGLSTEAIVLLIRRLKETGSVSLRQFERAALDWSKRGIKDAGAAEKYISGLARSDEYAARVAKTLGLSFEAMSAVERRTAGSWESLALQDEDIMNAYKKSLPYTKGNSPIAYMNKILIKDAAKKQSASPEAPKDGAQAVPGGEKRRYDYEKIRKRDREYLKRLRDEDI